MARSAYLLFSVLTFASSFALKLSLEQTTDVYQGLARRYPGRITKNMMKLLDANETKTAEIAGWVNTGCDIATTVIEAYLMELEDVEYRPPRFHINLPFGKRVTLKTIAKVLMSTGKVFSMSLKIIGTSGERAEIDDAFLGALLTLWEAISAILEQSITVMAIVSQFIGKCYGKDWKLKDGGEGDKDESKEDNTGFFAMARALLKVKKKEKGEDEDDSERDFVEVKPLKRNVKSGNNTISIDDEHEIDGDILEELDEDKQWCLKEFYKLFGANSLQTLAIACVEVSKVIYTDEMTKAAILASKDSATNADATTTTAP